MITEAEGYAAEKVNRANGEAQRFLNVLEAYSQAEEVTRRRFYLEAMQKVLDNSDKVYVVDEAVQGLLPLMDLTRGAPLAGGAGKEAAR
jgi:membrane protease subunit HflK